MLHRPTAVIAPSGDEDGDDNDQDPFDADEKDPLKTGALDSSLWELKSLQKHYLSHVSTMGKIFEEVFTKPEFNLDDFLDHTYATVSPARRPADIKRVLIWSRVYHSCSRPRSSDD